MAIEMRDLLKGQRSNTETLERPFAILGAADRGEAVAYAYANAVAPSGYVIDDIEFREYYPLAKRLNGSLRCVKDNDDESNPLPDPGHSFNYVGGQIFMQKAINTKLYGAVTDDDTKKLINFNREAHTVDGVTLPITNDTVQYTKTIYLRESNFDLGSDLFPIYRYRYHTNTEAWGDWPIGAVLYLGASGSLSNKVWTINYQFAVGANRENAKDIVPIDDGIDKQAHEYVEVWFANNKNTDTRFKEPVGVKVHQVYNAFSLSLLKGLGVAAPVTV